MKLFPPIRCNLLDGTLRGHISSDLNLRAGTLWRNQLQAGEMLLMAQYVNNRIL